MAQMFKSYKSYLPIYYRYH